MHVAGTIGAVQQTRMRQGVQSKICAMMATIVKQLSASEAMASRTMPLLIRKLLV
jgi:hypothetical protein